MSGLKNVVKSGWHPEKEGKSWQNVKGVNRVAGLVGRGKETQSHVSEDHRSTPLSTLKDPSTFGPPPKTVQYHGVAAPSDTAASGPVSPTVTCDEFRREVALEPGSSRYKPVRSAAPPVPSRTNTHDLAIDSSSKPPSRTPEAGRVGVGAPATASKPSLPPRRPPRRSSTTDSGVNRGPVEQKISPTHDPTTRYLNQGALNNLGKAGVSVPGLNIGVGSPPILPQQRTFASPPQSPPATNRDPRAGLASGYSRLSTKASSPSPGPALSGRGTSFSEKQAALRTATSFQKDPSSVSLNDGLSAAKTANNFRERHGQQAAQGWKQASGLNQKYGIADKVDNYATKRSPAGEGIGGQESSATFAAKKKAPPPPPPKKREPSLAVGGTAQPPPIPIGSKPR